MVCEIRLRFAFLTSFLLTPIIRLSFSLRCCVLDLYQSYPQIFQRHRNDFFRGFVLRSSIFINKFVQLGVPMVVLSSNYYLIHLFLSPLVVTSIYIIQKHADNY